MVLLNADGLSKAFGTRTLFTDVDLTVEDGDSIGLVGHNGVGKSTLLRILAGDEPADAGEITRARDLRLEYLDQRPELRGELTALEQTLVDGPPEFDVVRDYDEASRALEETPDDPECVERVTELSEKMDRVGGWSLENDAKTILSRVGIEDIHQPVASMSGGQQRRVALARALIRPSDLLMLDEPTNHLDVDTIEWLEGYLDDRSGGLLMVTHDRYFLDRICDRIVEIDHETVFSYAGNYSTYLKKREERYERMRKKEQKRQNLARQEREWLQRGPKARTTKSKDRVQRAKELLNTSYAPDERDDVEIDTVESRLGKKTVFLEGVSKSWGEQKILEDITYRFGRNERVGIVGPNGVGKSTLLEMIIGRVEPDEGTIERGETVVFGYYDQQSMDLDPEKRVHDYIVDISNRIETADGELSAADMLEKFLFDRDRQWEPIKNLSGGEKRRLYLLGVLMRSPNFLLLDEPTNDLDIETLNVLEDYLDDFDGAVVTVSHDRHFLDRTVDHLFVFQGEGQIERFPGVYSDWLEHRQAQKAEKARQARAEKSKSTPEKQSQDDASDEGLNYREQQELESLEVRIAEIEERLSEIDDALVEQAGDYEKARELDDEKQTLESELDEAMDRWETLAERA